MNVEPLAALPIIALIQVPPPPKSRCHALSIMNYSAKRVIPEDPFPVSMLVCRDLIESHPSSYISQTIHSFKLPYTGTSQKKIIQ